MGQSATPNRIGSSSDDNEYTARFKTIACKKGRSDSPPIPLENGPWCGEKFTKDSFKLYPNPDTPTNLQVICVNRACDFAGHTGCALLILSVDEPICRRLPCFLIATVDKFAALPWTGKTGALFGLVNRYDAEGFYGPCQPRDGQPLPNGRLPAPELIIQDELHLISGPLGTIAGLYETALEALCLPHDFSRSRHPPLRIHGHAQPAPRPAPNTSRPAAASGVIRTAPIWSSPCSTSIARGTAPTTNALPPITRPLPQRRSHQRYPGCPARPGSRPARRLDGAGSPYRSPTHCALGRSRLGNTTAWPGHRPAASPA